MVIDKKTTLKKLNGYFPEMKGSLIHGWEKDLEGETGEQNLEDLQRIHPTWNSDDVLYGLRNLERAAQNGEYVFELSDRSNLIYLPAQKRSSDHYFILCAGGAYGAVCTMIESLPMAARLNELGFDCFALNYHVAEAAAFHEGLYPKPLEDIAVALKLISEQKQRFQLDQEKYYLAGFSAGGHLAAVFALKSIASDMYHMPSPKGLLLLYPLVSLDTVKLDQVRDYMTIGLYGIEDTRAKADCYDIIKNMDEKYPETFYVYCRDDDTVSPENAKRMEEELAKHQVRHRVVCFETGGHGFGLGSTAPGSDYVEAAAAFLQEDKTNVR